MASKNASRDRFKYGICLNEDCPMSKTKEVQQISMRSELVCKECGMELRECPPPKKSNLKPLIIVLVTLVVIGGAATATVIGIKNKPAKEETTTIVEETPVTTPVVKEEPKAPATPKPQGYTWTGEWKNGKAHGVGTYTYKVETLIDKRDPQKRVAKAGDYIIGEYHSGKLVQGRWYDSKNNLKGSIIIGM